MDDYSGIDAELPKSGRVAMVLSLLGLVILVLVTALIIWFLYDLVRGLAEWKD